MIAIDASHQHGGRIVNADGGMVMVAGRSQVVVVIDGRVHDCDRCKSLSHGGGGGPHVVAVV